MNGIPVLAVVILFLLILLYGIPVVHLTMIMHRINFRILVPIVIAIVVIHNRSGIARHRRHLPLITEMKSCVVHMLRIIILDKLMIQVFHPTGTYRNHPLVLIITNSRNGNNNNNVVQRQHQQADILHRL